MMEMRMKKGWKEGRYRMRICISQEHDLAYRAGQAERVDQVDQEGMHHGQNLGIGKVCIRDTEVVMSAVWRRWRMVQVMLEDVE